MLWVKQNEMFGFILKNNSAHGLITPRETETNKQKKKSRASSISWFFALLVI